mgnify:CR=1 FL=1
MGERKNQQKIDPKTMKKNGGTQKSTKKESKNNCKKRDGRHVGERKKQPKINLKTIKMHYK